MRVKVECDNTILPCKKYCITLCLNLQAGYFYALFQ
nr:MAG TPA: hypothetical protein [Caudoviricetes sp.]